MEYIKVLLPSIVVGLIFWYVIRAIIRSDSIERNQMDKYYAQLAESEGASPARSGSHRDQADQSEGDSHGAYDEGRSH